MDVLHHHLEAIESSGLWNLDLCHKSLSQVLKNNTITGSKETKNMFNEMLLILGEIVPVSKITSKIDFFSGPETCLLIFVTLPDIIVLDW